MSRAMDIFQRIQNDPYSEVHRMVSSSETEDYFLDYKGTEQTYPSRSLHPHDAANLAKAISGFGNGEGGIVIWGVDCRRDTDGTDKPIGYREIGNVKNFKTHLDSAISGATIPPLGNVTNLEVYDPEGRGIAVVTYIPAGTNAPIKAIRGKEDYFVRAGSEFVRIPPGILAGMFGKRPNPVITGEFSIPVQKPQSDTSPISVNIYLLLTNKGRGIAHDAYIMIESSSVAGVGFNPMVSDGWKTRSGSSGNIIRTAWLEDTYLPPDDYIVAATLRLSIMYAHIIEGSEFQIIATCGSRDGPASQIRFKLPGEKLVLVAENLFSQGAANPISLDAVSNILNDGIVR